MDSNIKKEIMLSHYEKPINRGLINDDSYVKINMNSDNCIDEIDIMTKIVNDRIIDIRFDGEACAICTSSTSVMIQTLIGKTITEAKEIINNYYNMIEEKPFDENILDQALAYQDISKQPNRKKCALLSWWGIDKIISR